MLINRKTLTGIKDGRITVAFRQWKRPTVKAGGTLRTEIGVVAIEAIDEISLPAITAEDAHQAGFGSLDELHRWLDAEKARRLYRIELRFSGPDPRESRRTQEELSHGDLQDLRVKLKAIDRRLSGGPTCIQLLQAIGSHPGTKAVELAGQLGIDGETLKRRVRALKELGLTISLQPGYCLSPRGEAFLKSSG